MPHWLRASVVTMFFFALWLGPLEGRAEEFVTTDDAQSLGLKPYWNLVLKLDRGESLDRLVLVDENVYAITPDNLIRTVHADTGIFRWTAQVSKPGHRILGPSHAGALAFFTAQTGVHLFNRRTGRPADDPRSLRGVVIEVVHDTASVNIGSLHGLRLGTVLSVYRLTRQRGRKGDKIADLRVTVIEQRRARGRLSRLSPAVNPDSGDIVEAQVKLPLPLVPLPFAPSSPAIAEDGSIYYGASNGRFYKLTILDGFRQWQFGTLSPVSAIPRLFKGDLYVAGQDGRVISCRASDKQENWTFQTEGAIFVDPWVDDSGVYVSSSDRSVYALRLKKNLSTNQRRRRWRRPFEAFELGPPVVAADTVFVAAPGERLYALDSEDGQERWHVDGPAHFLTVDGDRVLIAIGREGSENGGGVREIVSLDLATGRRRATLPTPNVDFVVASAKPLTIILGDRRGCLQCLRSVKYPYLRPEQLAEVLAADHEAVTGEPVKPAAVSLPSGRARPAGLPGDPFRSRSTAPPVGGHGLLTPPGGPDKSGDKPPKPKDEPGNGSAGGE